MRPRHQALLVLVWGVTLAIGVTLVLNNNISPDSSVAIKPNIIPEEVVAQLSPNTESKGAVLGASVFASSTLVDAETDLGNNTYELVYYLAVGNTLTDSIEINTIDVYTNQSYPPAVFTVDDLNSAAGPFVIDGSYNGTTNTQINTNSATLTSGQGGLFYLTVTVDMNEVVGPFTVTMDATGTYADGPNTGDPVQTISSVDYGYGLAVAGGNDINSSPLVALLAISIVAILSLGSKLQNEKINQV